MKRLSEYAKNRDNNFNLIRFIVATLVLVTHSFVLALGRADAEPLRIYPVILAFVSWHMIGKNSLGLKRP